MPRRPDSLIAALGFTADQERLYQRLLTQSGREWSEVPASLMRERDDLRREVEPFVEAGMVAFADGRMEVEGPDEALRRILGQTADEAERATARLRQVADALPFLSATSARPAPGQVHDIAPLDGELSSGGDVPALIKALLLQSRGDVLQLRPDLWRLELAAGPDQPDPLRGVLGQILAGGRRMRTIYPVQAVHEARWVLAERAELGEEIRVLPHLPTRMLVIGRTHAVLPEPLGFVHEPRSLIRQRGLVEALALWFEALWERAAPAPGITIPGRTRGPDASDVRRFLLQELAGGAQDEQIARRLGLSLRTVRRRVAELMVELGAESRFQAGVEAARRGWL